MVLLKNLPSLRAKISELLGRLSHKFAGSVLYQGSVMELTGEVFGQLLHGQTEEFRLKWRGVDKLPLFTMNLKF